MGDTDSYGDDGSGLDVFDGRVFGSGGSGDFGFEVGGEFEGLGGHGAGAGEEGGGAGHLDS